VSWVLPTAPSAGNVIASAWGDDVVGDLTVLQTQIGLFGISGAIAGTPPSAGTPQFLLQIGSVGVSASSGNFSFSFPTGFPNGLAILIMQPTTNLSGTVDQIVTSGTSTKSTAIGQYFRSGAGVTGSVSMCFQAIGW
jgi:hypothetical protein